MSDVSITVEAQEFIDSLDTNEKKFLVRILKEDLEEDFDAPIDPDWEKRFSGNVQGEIYSDIDDIVWNMSSWEKQSLYDELKDECGEDCECEESKCVGDALSYEADSYQARELAAAFTDLWRSRNMLTKSQIERIQAITKEPYV
jgi:hypothetical protein